MRDYQTTPFFPRAGLRVSIRVHRTVLIEYNGTEFLLDMHVESVTCLEQLNPSCNMHVRIAITCMLHKPSCYMSVTCVCDMYPTCM